MNACPEIELLTSERGRGLAAAHLESCEACAAVATLAEVRSERRDGRDDACLASEVAMALGHAGLLDAAEQAELVQHLESCASCNEAAVRLRALPRSDDEVTDETAAPAMPGEERRRPRLALGWALASALIAVLAFGAGLLVRPRAASVIPVPTLLPAGGALVGASAEPILAPAPSVAPVVSAPGELVDPLPRSKPELAKSPRRVPDVIDPWAERAPLSPEPVPSGVPRPSAERAEELKDPWATGVGYLTLVCQPFCDKVRVSGKDLGPSPIVRAPLAPGVHAVVLERGSTKRNLSVRISAQQTTVLRISMTPVPPADPGY